MSRTLCILFLLFGTCMFMACVSFPPRLEGKVDLTPNDPRPVYGIIVEDHDEIAHLEQQLKLEPLYFRDSTLFFHEVPGLINRLQDNGYTPTKANSYQVYQRVVRVVKKGKEEELLKTGVRLINREHNFWIVQGSLALS